MDVNLNGEKYLKRFADLVVPPIQNFVVQQNIDFHDTVFYNM